MSVQPLINFTFICICTNSYVFKLLTILLIINTTVSPHDESLLQILLLIKEVLLFFLKIMKFLNVLNHINYPSSNAYLAQQT